jgi:hypothetical protein
VRLIAGEVLEVGIMRQRRAALVIQTFYRRIKTRGIVKNMASKQKSVLRYDRFIGESLQASLERIFS